MSLSTAQGMKQLMEALVAAEADPLAAREAILSLQSELGDLDQIAEQLARTEERLMQVRMAFEEAPIGMAILEADGRFVNVNPALCRLLGYSAAELADMWIEQVTHPDDRAIDQSEAVRLWQGQISSYTIQKRYQRKNCTTVAARLIASVLHDESGEPLYKLAIVEEISPATRAPAAGGSVDQPSPALCRTCKSDRLVRSRLRLWEWPVLLLLCRPVRCRSCGRRALKLLWAGVPGRADI